VLISVSPEKLGTIFHIKGRNLPKGRQGPGFLAGPSGENRLNPGDFRGSPEIVEEACALHACLTELCNRVPAEWMCGAGL